MNKTSCSLVTLYGRMPATQPSGQGSRNGIPRFFRRLAEGVFDVDDLKFRTHELADVVTSAAQRYGFRNKSIVGVGYSNGANNASSLMLLYPHLLSGAVLFRPMVPFPMDFAPISTACMCCWRQADAIQSFLTNRLRCSLVCLRPLARFLARGRT